MCLRSGPKRAACCEPGLAPGAAGRVAVFLAVIGVFGTGTRRPDLAVAVVMATLGVSAGWRVMRLAHRELHAQAQ